MGRYYYDKKSTVDDYKKFTMSFLRQYGHLRTGSTYSYGNIFWKIGDRPNGSMTFIVEKNDDDMIGTVQVKFTQTNTETWEKKDFDYLIRIEATKCNYGGLRWWFIDPCSSKETRCSILYFQSNGYFAGRKMLNLTYDSRNESRWWIWWAEMKVLKAEALYDKIKYPYRNGKPTRKMRRVLGYIRTSRYASYYQWDIANVFWYR